MTARKQKQIPPRCCGMTTNETNTGILSGEAAQNDGEKKEAVSSALCAAE